MRHRSLVARLARLARASAIVGLALMVGGACQGNSTGPLPEGGVRVLFVGNSFTSANDLPQTIADMAKSINETRLVYKSVAKDNYAIEDHYYEGIAETIATNGWHYVVMQQGPSTTLPNRAHLTIWTEALDEFISGAGARSALFEVVPGGKSDALFDAVRQSYLEAAQAVDGMFIPAAEAWREAWSRDPALPLYASDNFHPSRMGTYLLALVHFEMLYDRPATDLPDIAYVDGRRLDLPAATVVLLQEAAHATAVAWGIK
jgi:hypothetical protein